MTREAKPWGATRGVWDHFVGLGLGEHLLPVVSAPVRVARTSKLHALGKVPSTINRDGEAVGIMKWTARHSSPTELERWAADDRLGICIQTRQVRALDLDCPDEDEVFAIQMVVAQLLGQPLPVRGRSNSAKALLGFQCEGYLPKRTVRTNAGGVIEFLGNGQQFIAAGAHWSSKPNEPSGARYAWEGGLPAGFPPIDRDSFERLWDRLVADFGVAGTATGGVGRERRRGESFDATDAVAAFLWEREQVVEEAPDGTLYVRCPWEHEHTSDSGPSATAWFPAGTNGYQQGHFKCLHAHCEGRGRDEYLDAVGYILADFDVLPAPEPRGDVVDGETSGELPAGIPLPGLKRSALGEAEAVLSNVAVCLGVPELTGCALGFDEALHQTVIREDEGRPWRAVTDHDMVSLRLRLETNRRVKFKPIGRELMRDAMLIAAMNNTFDSVRDWVEGHIWDGVPRVERFLSQWFGAEDSAYTRALGRYWWTAQAGRALNPGCQVDMVPVLVGAQGIGKSDALQRLVPTEEHYTEINLADDDIVLARKMRGVLLGEIAELRGLRSRDADSIKAWVTRRRERWTPKYMEQDTVYARRLLLVATTNDDEFLDDPTGERRWLPVRVGSIERDELAAVRDQLWAEGAALWREGGVDWQEAQELARAEHSRWKVQDVWEPQVREWLEETKPPHVQVRDIAVGALGIDLRVLRKGDEMRICKILRGLGWEKSQNRVDGVKAVRWVHTCPHLKTQGVDGQAVDLA
jgi:hypothetical protein